MEARVPGNVIAYNFHGTTRACNVGENANETSPCFKTNCALCSIMRTSFQMKFVSKYQRSWTAALLYWYSLGQVRGATMAKASTARRIPRVRYRVDRTSSSG